MSSAGSFATARGAITGDDLGFLASTLNRTGSYASTARISGVNEVTLRGLLPKPKPRSGLPPLPPPLRTGLTFKELIMLLCAEEEVSYADIMGEGRAREVSRPRQRFMWIVRQVKPNLSYPEIGRRFAGRDHTTIMHGVRAVNERLSYDEEERAKIVDLLAAVRCADGTSQTIEHLDYEILTLEARIRDLKAKREELSR